MINFLKKLFKIPQNIELDSRYEHHTSNKDLEWYFEREIYNSTLIKKNCAPIVLEHLMRKRDILRTQNKLSVDEKKRLGINPRLSITKELIDVLNEEGIKSHYPKSIITNLFYRASSSKSRHDQMTKLRSFTQSEGKVIIRSSGGGGGDCDWCQSNQDIEFSIHSPIEHLIDEHCSCDPYCYCYIEFTNIFEY